MAELAHAAGARLVVDNTFATPFAVRPAALGADVVVESATKFLSGHSDLIAGAVMSDVDTIREVQRRVVTFGGCLDPAAAYLLWRGLQTFEVRLARQTSSAARLADALAARDDVHRVVHPSRPDHPQHELAAAMMPRGTAMLTVEVAGGDRRALAVLRELRLFTEATSLGGVESLASTPFNSSHFSLSAADRAAAGIGPGTLRLSVGLEDPDALLADLAAALDAHRGGPAVSPWQPDRAAERRRRASARWPPCASSGVHGVRGVALTFVDTAGITRVKAVPLARLAARRGQRGRHVAGVRHVRLRRQHHQHRPARRPGRRPAAGAGPGPAGAAGRPARLGLGPGRPLRAGRLGLRRLPAAVRRRAWSPPPPSEGFELRMAFEIEWAARRARPAGLRARLHRARPTG